MGYKYESCLPRVQHNYVASVNQSSPGQHPKKHSKTCHPESHISQCLHYELSKDSSTDKQCVKGFQLLYSFLISDLHLHLWSQWSVAWTNLMLFTLYFVGSMLKLLNSFKSSHVQKQSRQVMSSSRSLCHTCPKRQFLGSCICHTIKPLPPMLFPS